MKKLIASAAVVCTALASTIAATTPAQAQAASALCLNSPGFINTAPMPVTETQFRQDGVTITAKGLPRNPKALGQMVVVKGDLRNHPYVDELTEDSSPEMQQFASLMKETNMKFFTFSSTLSGFFFETIDPERIVHFQYFTPRPDGTVSFTFGGKEQNQRSSPVPPELEQALRNEYGDKADDLIAGLNDSAPDFPRAANDTVDVKGTYSIGFNLSSDSFGESDGSFPVGPYSFFFDGTSASTSFGAVEFEPDFGESYAEEFDNEDVKQYFRDSSQKLKNRVESLERKGLPRDGIVRHISTLTACSSFAVSDDPTADPSPAPSEDEPETPAPSPNPSEDPTQAPSPTPSDEEAPTPDPSHSDSSNPEPTPSETPTPTPEPSPTPSESSAPSETPAPEPSETSAPTPEGDETPVPDPSPSPSVEETRSPEPSPTPSESSTPGEAPTPEPSETSAPTPAPAPKESTTPTPGDSPSAMPRTGTHIMGALAAAGTLLALGTAITLLSRRRSQRQ